MRRRVVPAAGDLALHPLMSVLHSLAVGRESGRLTITAGDARKAVILLRGQAVNVASGQAHETLGAHLVRAGVLDEQRLHALRATSVERGVRLAELLLQERLLDANSLYVYIREHLKEILVHTLAWTEGSFTWEAGEEHAARVFRAEMDLPRLILEGLRRYPDGSTISAAMPVVPESRAYRRADAAYEDDALRPTPREARMLRFAMRRARVQEMAAQLGLDIEGTCREIFPYFALETVGFDTTPEPGPPISPSGLVEVPDDRPSSIPAPPDLAAQLKAPAAAAFDGPDRILQAQILAQEARKLLAEGRPERAVVPLRRALRLASGDASFKADLAFALLSSEPIEKREEARALARDASRSAPDLPTPWFVIGRIEAMEGKLDRAAGYYRKALQLDPKHEAAAKELERMPKRK